MTLTSAGGRFVVEFEQGAHIFIRVPKVGGCFLSLDGPGPAGRRMVWYRWTKVEQMLRPR